MITAVASTALSIVREKEVGTMEQVRMAPIDTFSFVVGKTIPVLPDLAGVGGAHHPGLDGAVRAADARQLAGAARGRCRCSSSVRSATGLLISTVADTQQVAFQMALLISLLPTIMLSGFIFPISSMPQCAAGHHLRRARPLFPGRAARHRAQGHGAHAPVVPQLAALAIYAAAMLGAGVAAPGAGAALSAAPALPRVEGVPRAAAEPAALRRRRRRADHPADDARVRRDDGRRDVPVWSSPTAIVSGAAASSIARFDGSRNFTVVDTRHDRQRGRAVPRARHAPGWRCRFRPATAPAGATARPVTVQVVADGSDSNSTTVALGYATSLIGGYAQELVGRGARRRQRPAAHRRAHPRLVQPAAREPALHDSRRARAGAAGRDGQPGGDGDRAREGARHARAAERHAAAALGADRRQAAAVRR